MKNKKAAMFGLDARIALSIFGLLSIIVGASLYNAIEKSTAVRLIAQINELKKAIDQYTLDTGTYLPTENTSSELVNPSKTAVYIGNLVYNREGVPRWRGPYYNSDPGTNPPKASLNLPFTKNDFINKYFYAERMSDENWGGPDIADVVPQRCIQTNCNIYLYRAYSIAAGGEGLSELQKLYYLLEKYLDNNDGPGVGKVRAVISTSFGVYVYLSPEFRTLKGI